MNQNEIFEFGEFPQELVAEQSGAFESEEETFESEEEVRRGGGRARSGSARPRPMGAFGAQGKKPRPPGGFKPKPKVPRPPRPPRWPPRRPWPGGGGAPYPVVEAYPGPAEPTFAAAGPVLQGSERIRWAQDCLNQAMSMQLPVDGILTAATRSVIRSFQQRENLRVTGILGPDTEEALKRACAGGAAPAPEQPAAGGAPGGEPSANGGGAPADQEWGLEAEEEGFLGDVVGRIAGGIGSAYGRVTDVLGGASGSRIIDLTATSDKSLRKGKRDPKKVYALVLHQMACCFKPKDPLKRFLNINSHFAIAADGRILQLHPITELLWSSNGFNAGSVAVEFAGNFPNIRGKWWKGDKYGKNRPTPQQLEAGRYLVRYLIKTMGLTHILAHRQSSNTRENDPGPEVWYHVGQWAVENLGLKDGGPGFKLPNNGNPIPDEWRNWGRGAAREVQELGEFGEAESFEGESEEELWRGEPEGPWTNEVSLQAALNDAKASGPGIYTIYKDRRRLYVGKSHNLRRRLQQHLWCLQHMGVDPASYAVKLTPMRGATPDQLQRVESAVITKWGRQPQGGMLTNAKTRELEEEIWGEAWT
jgi:hypothetical protein